MTTTNFVMATRFVLEGEEIAPGCTPPRRSILLEIATSTGRHGPDDDRVAGRDDKKGRSVTTLTGTLTNSLHMKYLPKIGRRARKSRLPSAH